MNSGARRQIDERLQQQMSQSMRRAYNAHQRGDLLRRARYAHEYKGWEELASLLDSRLVRYRMIDGLPRIVEDV